MRAGLKTGELVKDEAFTLFESVGALEVSHWYTSALVKMFWTEARQIMDPKMDSGYLVDGETLEDDYDFSTDLSPAQVLGIMDQLLCFEVRGNDV